MKHRGGRAGHIHHPGCAECGKVRETVFRLLDGRLTPARRRDVVRHLKACPACFSRLEFERIMRQVMRKRVLAEQCPVSLVRRVRAMIARECTKPGGRRGR